MASKKALAWLESQGVFLSHNGIERGNFAAGRGRGRFAMRYQIIETDSRYGSSKRTVGWAATLEDARRQRDALEDATRDADEFGRGGAEWVRGRSKSHYIRDVFKNETVF